MTLIPVSDAEKLWTRLDPTSLANPDWWMTPHGGLMIGAVAIRSEKVKNRWHVNEVDVMSAGEQIAELRNADLSQLRTIDRYKDGWQSRLADALDWTETAGAGVFRSREWGYLLILSVADKVRGEWAIPRAYASLIVRMERTRRRLETERNRCQRCGNAIVGWAPLPMETESGCLRVCEPCREAALQELTVYAGEFDGRRYPLRSGPAARTYRCASCAQQASYWDHCHEHGLIRGPLCNPCNTADTVLTRGERPAIEHLWRCTGCRSAQSIPTLAIAKMVQAILLGITFRNYEMCHPEAITLKSPRRARGIDVRDAVENRAALTAILACPQCGSGEAVLSPAELAGIVVQAESVIRTGDWTALDAARIAARQEARDARAACQSTVAG